MSGDGGQRGRVVTGQRWPRPVPIATGEGLKNSTSAEGLRRRLQGAMPHGGWKRIAERSSWEGADEERQVPERHGAARRVLARFDTARHGSFD